MSADPPDPTPDRARDPEPDPGPDLAPGPDREPRVQEALAWEARNAQRAGVVALVAAAATIVGSIVSALAQSAVPEANDRIVTVLDTLRLAGEGQPIPGGRLAAVAEHLGDNPLGFVLGGVLTGLGGLLAFGPLAYLFRAARHRKPQLSQLALLAAAIGAVGYGVGLAFTRIGASVGASDFGSGGDRSNSEAADALNNSGVVIGGLFAQVGQLALAIGFALIALNAMRVGLLTRFAGVLGVIVGATLILPLDQFGLIRASWLAIAGVLILGRWPGGRPAAWATGEAVPWPTQQQVREERERLRREREGGDEAAARGAKPSRGRGKAAAHDEERAPRGARAAAAPAGPGDEAAPVVAEAQAQASQLNARLQDLTPAGRRALAPASARLRRQ